MQVPLQYSDPTAGNAEIALIMSPSNYSSGGSEYLGPVLFNPGNTDSNFKLQGVVDWANQYRRTRELWDSLSTRAFSVLSRSHWPAV